MASEATLERTNSIRASVRATHHVNVTELARSKKWREQLPDCDVMEVIDHGDNAGWLVSDAGMGAMLDTISYLEEQLEQAQMAAIAKARQNYSNWLEGDELARAALEVLDKRGDDMAAVLDAC